MTTSLILVSKCVCLTRALCRLHTVRPWYGDPARGGWGVSLCIPHVDCAEFWWDRWLQRLPGLHPLTALLRPISNLGHRPPPQHHAAVLLRLAYDFTVTLCMTAGGVHLVIALSDTFCLIRSALFPAYGVRACCHGNGVSINGCRHLGVCRHGTWPSSERCCAIRDLWWWGRNHGGAGPRLWALLDWLPW